MTEEYNPTDGVLRRTVLKTGAVGAGSLAVGASAAAGGPEGNGSDEAGASGDVVTQTADVVGQGPDGDVVSEDGATLHRTADAILVELSMPTPESGEYTYPSEPPEREGEWWTDEDGDLEAFSLWVFTFNHPDECEDGDCSGDDVGEPAGGGVYNVAGHAFGGPDLTFNGFFMTDTELYEADGEPMGVRLERPLEAEVHLAVAPHGAFDPEMMPEILETPVGPGPDIWWIALFDPPE